MQVTEIILSNTGSLVYARANDSYKPKDIVIVSNSGHFELGKVKRNINLDEIDELVDIDHIANEDDIRANCDNCKYARSIMADIKIEAEKAGLDIKISSLSFSLNKTKLTINYTADSRIDFRDLVKTLGAKYKTRIEMHQIGNRDETKNIGALGICGRETCCKAFLDDFGKISIKMAKNQDISLNPNRINGMCGRLLCCLRYEDEYYENLQKKLPKLHSTITTPDGKGTVSNINILKETISVTFTKDDSSEIKVYTIDELTKDKK